VYAVRGQTFLIIANVVRSANARGLALRSLDRVVSVNPWSCASRTCGRSRAAVLRSLRAGPFRPLGKPPSARCFEAGGRSIRTICGYNAPDAPALPPFMPQANTKDTQAPDASTTYECLPSPVQVWERNRKCRELSVELRAGPSLAPSTVPGRGAFLPYGSVSDFVALSRLFRRQPAPSLGGWKHNAPRPEEPGPSAKSHYLLRIQACWRPRPTS
jgi:hypothetical protein